MPYSINLVLRNNNIDPAEGWARIFLTPETKEDQHKLMVEIDRFPITLSPGVTTEISRQLSDHEDSAWLKIWRPAIIPGSTKHNC